MKSVERSATPSSIFGGRLTTNPSRVSASPRPYVVNDPFADMVHLPVKT